MEVGQFTFNADTVQVRHEYTRRHIHVDVSPATGFRILVSATRHTASQTQAHRHPATAYCLGVRILGRGSVLFGVSEGNTSTADDPPSNTFTEEVDVRLKN